jgi:hypothetical protein
VKLLVCNANQPCVQRGILSRGDDAVDDDADAAADDDADDADDDDVDDDGDGDEVDDEYPGSGAATASGLAEDINL